MSPGRHRWTALAVGFALSGGLPSALAGQAVSGTFRVGVTLGRESTPAVCGVAGSGHITVQCVDSSGAATPVTVSAPAPMLVSGNVPDGWTPWANYRGRPATTSFWSGLNGELFSRRVTIGGIEFLELTLSW